MDNEKAIGILKTFIESELADGDKVEIYEWDLEAIDMAIEIVKRGGRMRRLIDAEETIKAIEEVKKIMNEEIKENDRKDLINFVNGLNQACLCVEQQPTVEERPTGKWITINDTPHCSECGYIPPYDIHLDDIYYSNYCPECGSFMNNEEVKE